MYKEKIMKKLTVLLLSLLLAASLSAEIIGDKALNYTLDLPEGFYIEQADTENNSYLFKHQGTPVQLIVKVQEKENSSAFDVLETAMSKLKAKASYDMVKWEGNECSVSSFDMTLDQDYSGWSVTAPLEKPDTFISVIAYSPKGQFEKCQQFIISILNSLTVSDITSRNPGVFLAYAFPKEGDKTVNLTINGKRVTTTIDKSDEDASQFLVDMEFGVLTLYGNHPLWKEAWQRYYRLVFRDNFGRLTRVSDDIYAKLYKECIKARREDPDTEYVSRLLTWTQGFNYERNQTKNSSDLTPPVKAICGKGSDCDSRSLLLCCIMQEANIDSILLISREFSHAMCAFDVNGMGQRFETSYGSYLMCETTAPVTPGMIAAEHQDRSKWIVVD